MASQKLFVIIFWRETLNKNQISEAIESTCYNSPSAMRKNRANYSSKTDSSYVYSWPLDNTVSFPCQTTFTTHTPKNRQFYQIQNTQFREAKKVRQPLHKLQFTLISIAPCITRFIEVISKLCSSWDSSVSFSLCYPSIFWCQNWWVLTFQQKQGFEISYKTWEHKTFERQFEHPDVQVFNYAVQ